GPRSPMPYGLGKDVGCRRTPAERLVFLSPSAIGFDLPGFDLDSPGISLRQFYWFSHEPLASAVSSLARGSRLNPTKICTIAKFTIARPRELGIVSSLQRCIPVFDERPHLDSPPLIVPRSSGTVSISRLAPVSCRPIRLPFPY